MPKAPPLPDTIRTTDPAGLTVLRTLAKVVGRLQTAAEIEAARMTERNRLLAVARRVHGVSWADLARVAGISDPSVIQAVERYEREHDTLEPTR